MVGFSGVSLVGYVIPAPQHHQGSISRPLRFGCDLNLGTVRTLTANLRPAQPQVSHKFVVWFKFDQNGSSD